MHLHGWDGSWIIRVNSLLLLNSFSQDGQPIRPRSRVFYTGMQITTKELTRSMPGFTHDTGSTLSTWEGKVAMVHRQAEFRMTTLDL